ncbi:uncharacterized protein G2W53_009129 [Senna tora]|uniref:Uncharacterized protein n=1 Tax=Senna tora TaxID=362788 RepID=A0A835C9J6_9FABA|nr:uncharacterized protein G2W53_009129 [Senna tora]
MPKRWQVYNKKFPYSSEENHSKQNAYNIKVKLKNE